MKLETTKGKCDGTAVDCVDFLTEHQPSHASVRIGGYVATIHTDGTDDRGWSRGLRSAIVEITIAADIDGGEEDWQQYLSEDSLAELVLHS